MAVLYAIYTPSLPFEVRCESGIYLVKTLLNLTEVQ